MGKGDRLQQLSGRPRISLGVWSKFSNLAQQGLFLSLRLGVQLGQQTKGQRHHVAGTLERIARRRGPIAG
jgi:hypothetical protein